MWALRKTGGETAKEHKADSKTWGKEQAEIEQMWIVFPSFAEVLGESLAQEPAFHHAKP
jgi:hypothetical protein